MLIIKTDTIDKEDLDIVLASGLVKTGSFYNLTLEEALEEETNGKELVYVEYTIDTTNNKLVNFRGWTEDRIVVNLIGMGIEETLLTSFPRNPPHAEGIFHK